jgi:hypothetical protein
MIVERTENKLSILNGKYLSVDGRLVLINSILTSLPMSVPSFFVVPIGVLEKIEYFRSKCFWRDDVARRKNYILIKWSI